MASKVEISAQIPASKASALNLQVNSQKIRSQSQTNQAFVYIAENFDQVKGSIDRLETAVRTAPAIGTIAIDSADILNLSVGGPKGPGSLNVYSGPPSYTRIGWDGTDDSGFDINISSVSGASVTTSAPHGLAPGDIVHIRNCSSLVHNGYWQVDHVSSATVYTLLNPPAGSGSGGTSTLQFAGGWRHTFAIGGTNFADAKLVALNDGSLRIQDADISITGNDGLHDYTLTLNSSLIRLSSSNNTHIDLSSAGVVVTDDTNTPSGKTDSSQLAATTLRFLHLDPAFTTGFESTAMVHSTGGFSLIGVNGIGAQIYNIGPTAIQGVSFKVGSSTVINSSRHGILDSLELTLVKLQVVDGGTGADNATTARFNLDVYSKAEVDAHSFDATQYYTAAQVDFLLNFKSNVGHSHNTISISGTTGTVAHTHTGSVS